MELQIIAPISENEKSRVYLASHSQLGFVVQKELLGEDKSALYERIRKLEQYFFPKIYEVHYEDGITRVVEEYIEGVDLKEKLGDKITPKQGFSYMIQILEAISVLHRMNPPLIHRDVKPENILVTKQDEIRLLDFDASREYHKDDRVQDTRLLGTRGYASPEQFGFAQTDERSDVYSVGIVCTQIAEKMDLSASEEKKLKKVLDKATMFDPKRRYQSAEQMLFAIQKTSQSVFVWGKARRLVPGVLVLMGIGIGALLWTSRPVSNGSAIETEHDPGNTDVYGFDILPESYKVSQQKVWSKMRMEEFLVENPGITEPEWGSSLEEKVFHFYKEQPQALLWYDYRFVKLAYIYPYLERYKSDHKTVHEKIALTNGLDCQFENCFLYIGVDTLQELKPGFYRFHLSFDEGDEVKQQISFYIEIHEKNVEENLEILAMSEVQNYYLSTKNDVFFNLMNTSGEIGEIYYKEQPVSEKLYQLTKDRRGVVISGAFFESVEDEDKYWDFTFKMKNGKEAKGRVLRLP